MIRCWSPKSGLRLEWIYIQRFTFGKAEGHGSEGNLRSNRRQKYEMKNNL